MRPGWLSASVASLTASLLWGVSSLPGCTMPTSSHDAGTTTIPVAGDSGTLGRSVTGTGCGKDPTTGVTLCTGTDTCPGVTVDPSVYPECGFYISGAVAYLACLCSGYLCPLGQPATCNEAAALLESSNEGSVCGEASNNQCTALSSGTGATGSDGGSDTGSGSGCDKACEAMCAGEPDCITLCNC